MKCYCVGARHRNFNRVDRSTGVTTVVDETMLYIVYNSPVDGLHGSGVKAISLPYGKFNLVEQTYDDLVVGRQLLVDLVPYGDTFIIEDIVPGDKFTFSN